MWPDAISYLIIRVILSALDWTDDEGNPTSTPRRLTSYRDFRPSLNQAHKAMWLELNQQATDRNPLHPAFKVDERWMKAWALKQMMGDELTLGLVDAIEKGTPLAHVVQGIELQAVAEWRGAWQAPDAMLRFTAKHTYNAATKAAVLAELARRKAERKAKKAS